MYKSILFLIVCFFYQLTFQGLSAQQGEIEPPDTTSVRIAAELLGLSFSQDEIVQMSRGVHRQKRSYQMIRDFELQNSIRPALQFNPLPYGFNPPDDSGLNEWTIPDNINLPDNPSDIAYMSIPELASLIKNEKISSVALTKLYLNRLKTFDDSLYCVINLTEASAFEQAAKADAEIKQGIYRGILHGIPFGVKDLLSYADYPTTWGAKPYEDQVLNETASVITKLNDAGAVLLAKLSLGALAMGDVWYGGTTRNPWNTKNGSSGSSAGPAAAVSAGLVPFAIGSETLGSIVSPSTRCSVTGLRPTFGRVSKYGAMALSWSMDKLGPICRSANDCAIVLDFIRGADELDISTISAGFSLPKLASLKGLKIAYLKDLFDDDYSFSSNDQQALEIFREMGADLQAISLPDDLPVGALRIILNAEAAAAFDDLTRSDRDSLLVSQSNWSWPNSFRTSRFIPAVEYIQANRIRSVLIRQVHDLFKEFDVIITPSYGGIQLTLTNLSGHPALLLPTGFTEKGDPSSITLLGNYFDEGVICAVGQLYQEKTKLHLRRPDNFK